MTLPGAQRVKRLTYRVAGAVDLEAHTEHWRDFVWEAGPIQVSCVGRWGVIQVWASTEAEARRVIAHALAISGWPQADLDAAEFGVRTVSASGYGVPGTCRLKRSGRGYAVRTRAGRDGPSEMVPYEVNH